MRAYTFADVALFRRCRTAFQYAVQQDTPPDSRRIPLTYEAACALRPIQRHEAFHLQVESDGFTATADLLVRGRDGSLELVFDTCSLQLWDLHILEAAYITDLLESSGYVIDKITALFLSSEYTMGTKIDYSSLYIQADVTRPVREKISSAERTICEILDFEPGATGQKLTERCLKPRTCIYWDQCTKDLPKPNIFSLGRMNNTRKFQLFNRGYVTLTDCLYIPKLEENVRSQILAELEKHESVYKPEKIRAFLATLHYPLCFLDFESYQSPVPRGYGMRPYEQNPFLYSLDIIAEPGAEHMHHDCFAMPEEDCWSRIALQLAEDVPDGACVLVYSCGLEKHFLQSFAGRFPQYKGKFEEMCANMRDMMPLFRNRDYYDRRMFGSCSLKKVAAAFDCDDYYANETSVHNGEDAARIYPALANMTPEAQTKAVEELRAYCTLDTLSMIKILQKLQELTERTPEA